MKDIDYENRSDEVKNIELLNDLDIVKALVDKKVLDCEKSND